MAAVATPSHIKALVLPTGARPTSRYDTMSMVDNMTTAEIHRCLTKQFGLECAVAWRDREAIIRPPILSPPPSVRRVVLLIVASEFVGECDTLERVQLRLWNVMSKAYDLSDAEKRGGRSGKAGVGPYEASLDETLRDVLPADEDPLAEPPLPTRAVDVLESAAMLVRASNDIEARLRTCMEDFARCEKRKRKVDLEYNAEVRRLGIEGACLKEWCAVNAAHTESEQRLFEARCASRRDFLDRHACMARCRGVAWMTRHDAVQDRF